MTKKEQLEIALLQAQINEAQANAAFALARTRVISALEALIPLLVPIFEKSMGLGAKGEVPS